MLNDFAIDAKVFTVERSMAAEHGALPCPVSGQMRITNFPGKQTVRVYCEAHAITTEHLICKAADQLLSSLNSLPVPNIYHGRQDVRSE
jgi:hypothetical protein